MRCEHFHARCEQIAVIVPLCNLYFKEQLHIPKTGWIVKMNCLVVCTLTFVWGCRDVAVVRALASHRCIPGSIPGPGVTCGLNKPFYSCRHSDLASEWKQGWSRLELMLFWYTPHCFYYANQVVLMLTSLHLHEKSREVCIKARSPPASLAFMAR